MMWGGLGCEIMSGMLDGGGSGGEVWEINEVVVVCECWVLEDEEGWVRMNIGGWWGKEVWKKRGGWGG